MLRAIHRLAPCIGALVVVASCEREPTQKGMLAPSVAAATVVGGSESSSSDRSGEFATEAAATFVTSVAAPSIAVATAMPAFHGTCRLTASVDQPYAYFSGIADGQCDIFRIHLGTRALEQVSFTPATEESLVINAAGGTLAFCRQVDPDAGRAIFLITIPFAQETALTHGSFDDTPLEFSPDGSVLYFARGQDRYERFPGDWRWRCFDVFRVHLGTGSVEQVTANKFFRVVDAAPSPGGDRLLVSVLAEGLRKLYMVPLSASGLPLRVSRAHRWLGSGPSVRNEGLCAWSPDGKSIVFESDRDGVGLSKLYVAGPDGVGIRAVCDDAAGITSLGFFNRGGTGVLIAHNRQTPTDVTGFLHVSVETGEVTDVFAE